MEASIAISIASAVLAAISAGFAAATWRRTPPRIRVTAKLAATFGDLEIRIANNGQLPVSIKAVQHHVCFLYGFKLKEDTSPLELRGPIALPITLPAFDAVHLIATLNSSAAGQLQNRRTTDDHSVIVNAGRRVIKVPIP